MKLSFDDEESLKEAVGSLCFTGNNPPSDPNTLQQMGSMLPQDCERNEDICFNNPPGDLNIPRRVGSSGSIQVVELWPVIRCIRMKSCFIYVLSTHLGPLLELSLFSSIRRLFPSHRTIHSGSMPRIDDATRTKVSKHAFKLFLGSFSELVSQFLLKKSTFFLNFNLAHCLSML